MSSEVACQAVALCEGLETSRNSLVRDSYINILYKAINVGSAALPLRLPHLDSAQNDNKDWWIL